jgi:hypothetical protein
MPMKSMVCEIRGKKLHEILEGSQKWPRQPSKIKGKKWVLLHHLPNEKGIETCRMLTGNF